MKREDLKALELSPEAIDAIMALYGKDIEKHKTALETSRADIEKMKADADAYLKTITEANATIESFKAMDIEGIKKTADEWRVKSEEAQLAIEKATADAATQLASLKFDHALEGALNNAGAKNIKAVRALLKTEELKLAEDGSIENFDTQLESIKSENNFLFNDDEPMPRIVTGGNSHSVLPDAVSNAARKGAGLPD